MVWAINPPVWVWIYAKLVADPLECPTVIWIAHSIPGLFLGKRCLQLCEDSVHLIVYVEPDDRPGKRTADGKVVTPRNPTACCSTPHSEILPELHGAQTPNLTNLSEDIWSRPYSSNTLGYCVSCEIASSGMATTGYAENSFPCRKHNYCTTP